MTGETRTDRMWTRTLRRSEQVVAGALLGGCLVSILGLGLLTWHNRARLQRVRTRFQHTTRILQVGQQAEQSLLAQSQGAGAADPVLVRNLRRKVSELRLGGGTVDPACSELLDRLDEALSKPGPS